LPWKIDEPLLLPPVVQEFVAKDHLARVLSLIRDDIDLTEITGDYESERGQPPFDPVMMTPCCSILIAAASTPRAALPRRAASALIS
jgi:hypothetical protein